jgi:hypothetical protein
MSVDSIKWRWSGRYLKQCPIIEILLIFHLLGQEENHWNLRIVDFWVANRTWDLQNMKHTLQLLTRSDRYSVSYLDRHPKYFTLIIYQSNWYQQLPEWKQPWNPVHHPLSSIWCKGQTWLDHCLRAPYASICSRLSSTQATLLLTLVVCLVNSLLTSPLGLISGHSLQQSK